MVYADYTYYRDTYLGNAIAEADFPRLVARASEKVDYLTRMGAEAFFTDMPDPIRKAVCAIAEIVQQSERGSSIVATVGGGEAQIRSETTSKHKIEYAASLDTASADGQRAVEAAISAAAAQYLTLTGLLYRGVRHC